MIDDTFMEPRTSRDTIDEDSGKMAITVLMLGILVIVFGAGVAVGWAVF